ncbi:hypothetical protein PPERSA_08847 [Pseudocohnilembus persalinus]|uniref:Lysosomal cystine transporter n=1 Tax=Pseudocohnilembus persalinus TaxID=266149 RepID=A0A0V0R3R8_PSEPJ|nr:hypothetical protein PPERSA_08847 [Pseudocohnilembus persalinus]|eukprot:KRX09131.1 hypothetical protein PPERSA_08847 [Pseudocohnilembus persalinus]
MGLSHTDQILSDTFGWIYTIVWGASFYGQIWEIFVLKNCEGIQLDYVLLNFFGYTFYSIYSSFGYFNPEGSGVGEVDIQDLVFCYHGLILNFVTIGQCIYYPKGKNKINLYAKILASVLVGYSIIYCFLTNVFDLFTPPDSLNTLNLLGYNKLVITLVKYTPQVYWNYKRKSTVGWNICNVLCDFSGGFFSLAQTVVQTAGGDKSSISGGLNIAKFLLGLITMFYDSIFIVQHYCLYRKKSQKEFNEILEHNKEDEYIGLGLNKQFVENEENSYVSQIH